MNDQIRDIKLSFTCHENWDGMSPTNVGRHCDQCNKTVHDLTNSKADEFRKIMAESDGSICGRFSSSQMASKPIIWPAWKKWLSAALVLIGINLFDKETVAQHSKAKQISQKTKTPEISYYTGDVSPEMYLDALPEFPGGYEKFNTFLSKNLHPVEGTKGRIIAQFTVDNKGRVCHPNIIKGLNHRADQEVLRVLKLSPKWIPAKFKNKPVASSYTIPVVFI